MAELRVLPPAKRFLKKIKDKELKARSRYQKAIDDILANPSIGEDKHGDLTGVKGYDIYYKKTNDELAYTVEYVENEKGGTEVVVVILAGTRENFYEALKRYW